VTPGLSRQPGFKGQSVQTHS